MIYEVSTHDEVFPVEGTNAWVDDGYLIITDGQGERVSVFAKGEWLNVIKREPVNQAAEPRKPRVWCCLSDADKSVKVVSAKGCHWKFWQPGETDETGLMPVSESGEGAWLWSSASGDTYDRTGPYTEVLDA